MSYKEHMTTEYDSKFSEVKGLEWDPWVGKNYHKTGIFIVGMSTDQRDGDDWTQNLKSPLTSRDASRTLAAWVNTADEKPFQYSNGRDGLSFQNTAKIFIDGVGAEYDTRAYAAFWESVAFNNYYQVVVPDSGDIPEQPDIEKSKRAFYDTVKIIKPKLVLAWTTEIWSLGLSDDEYETRDEKINGAWPRVSKQTPPIVGIKHPSRAMDGAEWFQFLCNDPASKAPVASLLQHLKQPN